MARVRAQALVDANKYLALANMSLAVAKKDGRSCVSGDGAANTKINQRAPHAGVISRGRNAGSHMTTQQVPSGKQGHLYTPTSSSVVDPAVQLFDVGGDRTKAPKLGGKEHRMVESR